MISLTINVADVITAPPTFTESVYIFEVAEGVHANVSVYSEFPVTEPPLGSETATRGAFGGLVYLLQI